MINTHHEDVLMRDAFLSEQLERDVLRVNLEALYGHGREADRALGVAMAALEEPAMLYAKALPEAADDITLMLGAHGFEVIDTAVTLERSRMCVADAHDDGRVRTARPGDEDAVVRLAQHALTTSRFSRDGRISSAGATRVKAAWARNYFHGVRGDVMVVVPSGDDDMDGFLLALRAADGAMVIDLVAVAAHARRRGLCRAMTIAAQAQCPEARLLRVGTQGSNGESLRAYERMGFVVVRRELVLHAHVNARLTQGARCA